MDLDRDKIIKYADELFRKNGLHRTTMDEIASYLQISKKTIYKHFSSKDDLIDKISDYWLEKSTITVKEIIESKDDVITKIITLLERHFCDIALISDKWISDLQIHFPKVWNKIDKFRDEKIFEYAKKLLKQGLKEKYFNNIPFDFIITSHIASVKACMNPDYLIKNNVTMNEGMRYLYDLQFKGILTEKGRKKYNEQRKKYKNK